MGTNYKNKSSNDNEHDKLVEILKKLRCDSFFLKWNGVYFKISTTQHI